MRAKGGSIDCTDREIRQACSSSLSWAFEDDDDDDEDEDEQEPSDGASIPVPTSLSVLAVIFITPRRETMPPVHPG